MSVTRTWKVYGRLGHRQAISFSPSFTWDFSAEGNVRILDVENSDKTGTNEYTLVHITRNTREECLEEIRGQVTDGLFENYSVGYFEEVV